MVDQLTKHLHRMVKSCRVFDTANIYSMDSDGKVVVPKPVDYPCDFN